MDLILEGDFSAYSNVREVFRAILQKSPQATGFLRISCPSKDLSGRIALSEGRYVVGAQVMETNEQGWEALKKLLSLKHGNFAFLDTGTRQSISMSQTLFIDINRLIEQLPALPESTESLFDEQALLDQVFSGGELLPLPRWAEAPSLSTDESWQQESKDEPAWETLSPFLNEPASKPEQAAASVPARSKSSSLRYQSPSQRGGIWTHLAHSPWFLPVLLLVAAILAVLVFWQLTAHK